MTRQTLDRALRAFRGRRPFQPFVIEFFSGDRVTITHVEAVTFNGDALIYLSPQSQYRIFESGSVCQLLDVAPPADG